jgi:hypothetical protein
MGEVGSRSQVRSSTKSQSRSGAKSRGGEGPRRHEARQPVRQGVAQTDVDTVLVGKKVVVVVVVGNNVARVVGRVTVMGRFWVVVVVEESEIESLRGVVYLNKGSIVAYMPLPDNNPDSNPKS